jgi:DNA-directed RNA polymerase II subunit RPB2
MSKVRDIVESMIGRDCKRELVAHQIDSFDDFVENRIADVVKGFNPIRLNSAWHSGDADYTLDSSIVVTNPRLVRPSATEHDGTTAPLTPDTARSRHFTYASDLLADIQVSVVTTSDGVEQTSFTRTFPGTKIGRIPVMVYSSVCIYSDAAARTRANMCPLDPGGYFIVGGNERVVVPQDRMSENRVFVFSVNKTVSYSYGAEVRSLVSERFGVPKLSIVKISSKPNVGGHFAHVTMHHVSANIPLFILFRALGESSDKSMYALLAGGHTHGESIARYLAGCSHDCMMHSIKSQVSALAWIAERCTAPGLLRGAQAVKPFVPPFKSSLPAAATAMVSILETELLPHVGACLPSKRVVLADMARRAVLVAMGANRPDDRDSYVNKRVDPTGIMLANLFRQCYGKFAKEARKTLAKDLATRVRVAHKELAQAVSMVSVARPSIIENGMRTALATGNWGVKNNAKVGVSQILSRMTYSATLSHLRRVCTSLDKTSKLIQPRKLHASQWGVFCPAETPEGHSVGVVKNLSIGARVTLPTSPSFCVSAILSGWCGPVDTSKSTGSEEAIVSVNYAPIARTRDPSGCTRALRAMRRSGAIHAHASIVHDTEHRQVRVLLDGGRVVRPLLIVRDGELPALTQMQPGTSWSEYLLSGAAEYMDIDEAGQCLIAMSPADVTPSHTHCEVHPSLVLGVLAAMIPFPDHNQSPRNSYQSAMGKQATGVYASNFRRRFDTHAMVLDCAQRTIVSSMIPDLLSLGELPSGANLIVAVSTLAGYNQEDSVVLNQSSLERGMFSTTVYHTIYEQVQKNPVSGEQEIYYCPEDSSAAQSTFNYQKLTPSGFPQMETALEGGDVVIGKCMSQKNGGFIDESVALRTNECGKLDHIVSSLTHGSQAINGDGYGFCQVRLRDSRRPIIGDKVASRAGQKGTVGMVLRQEDLPTTADGLVPDLIINPHALPSRMTVGQILEGVLGKACCMSGCFGDSTPFSDSPGSESVFDALERLGAERHGEEVMFDPRTGKQTSVTMFITPTYYQRLKHQVVDKVHGRGASGPMVMLTRQPAEGRARDGGLRVGEMEIECLLAHGIMRFLKERFMDCSDGYTITVCRDCGTIAAVNIRAKIHRCAKCSNERSFMSIDIPYAMKLMMQECEGMGVSTALMGAVSRSLPRQSAVSV